jgi:hypothetical protein
VNDFFEQFRLDSVLLSQYSPVFVVRFALDNLNFCFSVLVSDDVLVGFAAVELLRFEAC